MDITNAEFVISNTDVRKCPAGTFPEYAFIGRSNVGKSSLINMLTGRKGLAMTSATPGKTMLINHFLINKSWYIVDLPGYGYAKRGQKGQEQIKRIIESYILQREQMTCLFVLIDSRLAPQAIDLEFTEWLGENGVPFAIVFTKADKLKGGIGAHAAGDVHSLEKYLRRNAARLIRVAHPATCFHGGRASLTSSAGSGSFSTIPAGKV